MYQKLKQNLIDIYMNDGTCATVPTEAVCAAYAGASAAKNLLLIGGNPITKGSFSFDEEFIKHMSGSILATNRLGLSTTFETMEAFHPAQSIDFLLKEQQEHDDNPFWPFFDED